MQRVEAVVYREVSYSPTKSRCADRNLLYLYICFSCSIYYISDGFSIRTRSRILMIVQFIRYNILYR